MKKLITTTLAALVVAAGSAVAAATAGGNETGPPHNIYGCTPSETYNFVVGECQDNGTPFTLCHVAGLEEDPANTVTVTIAIVAALVGQGGHFNENGSKNAGHEQDYVGPCDHTPPPVDVCPNLEGDQAEPPEGYELSLGLCVKPDPAPPDPPKDPEDPTHTTRDCPRGESKWHGKCYPNDGQEQPDGSVIYGEQG